MFCSLLSDNIEKSSQVQNTFCEEIGKHKVDKNKYRDADFYPKIPINSVDKEILPSSVTWDRVEKLYEQCSNTEFKSCEIRRGLLKDDALIAVFSALMTTNEVVMKWFQKPTEIITGIVCVNIPFRGKVVSVNIDTKIPRLDGKLILSRPIRPGFPWSAFIEKALAKLLGSFHALEQLTVKEILYHIFGFSSKTVLSPSLTDKFVEEIGNNVKNGQVSFVTIGNKKESDESGLNSGSVYIIQNINKVNNNNYALLFNPGGKRRFISSFEERIDNWKIEAKFPKVKEDSFVFRTSYFYKYTESIILGYPTPKTQFKESISGEIKEGNEICEKQFKLKSDKFANINFVIESTNLCSHSATILEDGNLCARVVLSEAIGFFMVRTDPEKSYTIIFSSIEPAKISLTLCTDSAITIEEEDYKKDPLAQIGSGELTPGKHDGRFPSEPSNLACVPQWLLSFSEKGIIKFKILNKTICESKHTFFLAQTDGERMRTKGDFFYVEHDADGKKDSDEWEFDISDVTKKYVFGCYRSQINIITKYDFEIRAENPFELNRLSYIEKSMNSTTIEDKIASSKYDNRSPIPGNPGITRLKQWVLNVDQPKRVYVVFEHDEGKHTICIQQGNSRINHFSTDDHYMFESHSKFDTFDFNAQPGPYTFTVIREHCKSVTEFKITYFSDALLTSKMLPTLSTENCKVFSKDVRFQEDEGGYFFPNETTTPPEKQYYLAVPEPCLLIGIIDVNSVQDDSTFCIYIEDTNGKILNDANMQHSNEHAIANKDGKEWFTFNVNCDPEKGTVLTFCLTRKSGNNKASVAARFFAKSGLKICSAEEDLNEETKAELIKEAKESMKTSKKSRRPSFSENTKACNDEKSTNITKGPNQSNCCLLF